MFALPKAATQMGKQHLAHRRLIPHQLDELIDTILFQQILGALLLQRQAGIKKGEMRAFSASGGGVPLEPALFLHGFKQRPNMPAGTAERKRQLLQGGVLLLALAALP